MDEQVRRQLQGLLIEFYEDVTGDELEGMDPDSHAVEMTRIEAYVYRMLEVIE